MHQGQCLTNSQCSVALACPSNQIYSLCAGCDQTCDQRGQLVACTTQCRQQCTCPHGMYLDGQTCVTAEQCPQVCDSSLNEVFSTCAAGCDATCDEPQKACSTIKICRRRCTCPVNHVRSEDNFCIPVETCPVVDIQEVTACSQQLASLQNPLECDAVGDFATQQCNARECFCVQRHNGAELSGTRQPRAGYNINCQLYGNCPANMEFSTCATECPPTCNRRLPRCTRRCVLDCVCQNGMVRASSTNMTCVPESQCPVLSRCQAQRAGAGGNPQFPQCNPDGSYIPTQCDTNDNCYCVYENGTKIEGSDGNAGVLTMANYMACITARTCHNTPGMKFHPCAPPCDGMCAEPEPSCIFLESCTARCGCKTGYLLAADNQTCVQADACPSNEP
uniref:Thyroglobulin type-1 domain-containing protein n=1 Tax=Ciona savignyi TaxID=51511 RepID=H2Z4R4_CIOSA